MVEFVPDKFRITKKNIKIVYYNNEIEKFSVYRPRLLILAISSLDHPKYKY